MPDLDQVQVRHFVRVVYNIYHFALVRLDRFSFLRRVSKRIVAGRLAGRSLRVRERLDQFKISLLHVKAHICLVFQILTAILFLLQAVKPLGLLAVVTFQILKQVRFTVQTKAQLFHLCRHILAISDALRLRNDPRPRHWTELEALRLRHENTGLFIAVPLDRIQPDLHVHRALDRASEWRLRLAGAVCRKHR